MAYTTPTNSNRWPIKHKKKKTWIEHVSPENETMGETLLRIEKTLERIEGKLKNEGLSESVIEAYHNKRREKRSDESYWKEDFSE